MAGLVPSTINASVVLDLSTNNFTAQNFQFLKSLGAATAVTTDGVYDPGYVTTCNNPLVTVADTGNAFTMTNGVLIPCNSISNDNFAR